VRAGRQEGLWCGGGTQAACTWMWPDSRLGGMRGAHLEHVAHGRDAGGVPAGNVRVEVLQVIEEGAHVGDCRDVPVGDGAACRSGGSRVSVELLDLSLQGGLGREDAGRRGWRRRRWRRGWATGAASRSPARAIASGGEGRGARPRAADEQLVGGGQGVCVLCRESKGGRVYNGGRGACREAGERVRGGSVGMHGARLSKGWGPRARAERTSNMRCMVLTLEVSKLSGWLKADACCRVEGRGHMRCGEGEV
jgi:hypothetical protein